MSTGALATLLAQQPYSFAGLKSIGTVLFLFNLLLFLLFCGCITYRFTRNRKALSRSLRHPHESFYFGTFWVSIALLLYCIDQYGVPAAGPWLTKVLEIAFWTYAGCVFIVAVFQYHVIFDEEKLSVSEAMPSWILPMYPFLILGPLAAVLVKNQPLTSAVPIMIGGLCFQGLGWCFAFIMYTLYVTRLMGSGIPEPSTKPGMYVAVGPAGKCSQTYYTNHILQHIAAYTANTLVALGMEAPKVLPADFLGLPSHSAGNIWKAIGVPAGIFLWLLAFWFFALSTVSVLATCRKMQFSMNWWAFIFPNAGLTIALIKIAEALNSDSIKSICTAMTILLVIVWIGVVSMNGRAVWKGDVLWPGKDEDAGEEELENDEEEGDGHIRLP